MTERVVAFLRRAEERVVDELLRVEHGTALLTPSLPLVWQLNALRAEDAGASATELAAEAEAVLGGLGHRKVVVHDQRQGQSLASGFRRLGWNVYELLVLVRRRPPERRPADGAAAEVPRPTGAAALAAFRREQPFGWQEQAVRQLTEMDERMSRAIGEGHDFAAPPDDPACACRLYVHDRVGQVDEVGTVETRRNQGYATAAVIAAADAAEAIGCDLVFLLTDANDWPRRWYERLGFDVAGAVYEFLKLPLGP